MVNKFNENLERKMYENPKITLFIIVFGLLIFGFLIGMGYTVNIYNSDHINTIQIIERSAESTGLLEINGSLYHIEKMNNTISWNNTFILENVP